VQQIKDDAQLVVLGVGHELGEILVRVFDGEMRSHQSGEIGQHGTRCHVKIGEMADDDPSSRVKQLENTLPAWK